MTDPTPTQLVMRNDSRRNAHRCDTGHNRGRGASRHDSSTGRRWRRPGHFTEDSHDHRPGHRPRAPHLPAQSATHPGRRSDDSRSRYLTGDPNAFARPGSKSDRRSTTLGGRGVHRGSWPTRPRPASRDASPRAATRAPWSTPSGSSPTAAQPGPTIQQRAPPDPQGHQPPATPFKLKSPAAPGRHCDESEEQPPVRRRSSVQRVHDGVGPEQCSAAPALSTVADRAVMTPFC